MLSLAVAALLAASGPPSVKGAVQEKPAPANAPRSKGPPADSVLRVLAYPGALERGATDARYDWVSGFEKESGCRVEVATSTGPDDLFTRAMNGRFDVAIAAGDVGDRLIASNRVQELSTARIASYGSIDSRIHGTGRGVPFTWSPTVLLYNTKVFAGAPPSSWSVLYDEQKLPDGKSNKGRVEAWDGVMAIADAALFTGIDDPYSLDPKAGSGVIAALARQRKLIGAYWHDPSAHADELQRGDVAASTAWVYQANALKAKGAPYEWTIPKGPTTGWLDEQMLLKDSEHATCAYKWFEWSLRPLTQLAVAEWNGSLPVVASACKARAPAGSDVCATNGFDRLGDVRFWRAPPEYDAWKLEYGRVREPSNQAATQAL